MYAQGVSHSIVLSKQHSNQVRRGWVLCYRPPVKRNLTLMGWSPVPSFSSPVHLYRTPRSSLPMSSSPDPSSPVRRTPFAEGAGPIIIAVFTAILMFGPIPTISVFFFAYVWHHWTTLGVVSSKIDFLDQLLDSVDLMMVDQTRMTFPEASGLFLDTFKDERFSTQNCSPKA